MDLGPRRLLRALGGYGPLALLAVFFVLMAWLYPSVNVARGGPALPDRRARPRCRRRRSRPPVARGARAGARGRGGERPRAPQRHLGPLLRRIQDYTGCSMIVIEHDMPLLRSICDRMVCLELGSAIAEGTPREVLDDPRVIESYLGSDESAIRRPGRRSRKRSSGVTSAGSQRRRRRRREPARPRRRRA